MKTFSVRFNWYPFPCYYKANSIKELRQQFNKEYGKSTVKFILIN